MKKQLLLIVLLTGLVGFQSYAQLPEKAEDISPLLVGESIPDVALKAPDGSDLQILDILNQKPTVLLLYRGGWCPYCNIHLAEIQEAESEIIKLGYQIVAISPDSYKNLQLSGEENKLSYNLYSDADGKLCKAMGIAFKAPDKYENMLFEDSGGLNKGFLPVPSVFVTGTDGKILFEYINPEYKTRLSASLLVAVLKNLITTN